MGSGHCLCRDVRRVRGTDRSIGCWSWCRRSLRSASRCRGWYDLCGAPRLLGHSCAPFLRVGRSEVGPRLRRGRGLGRRGLLDDGGRRRGRSSRFRGVYTVRLSRGRCHGGRSGRLGWLRRRNPGRWLWDVSNRGRWLLYRWRRCRDGFNRWGRRRRSRGALPWDLDGSRYRLRLWFDRCNGLNRLLCLVALNGLFLKETEDVVENEVPIWLLGKEEGLDKFPPRVIMVGHFTNNLNDDASVGGRLSVDGVDKDFTVLESDAGYFRVNFLRESQPRDTRKHS